MNALEADNSAYVAEKDATSLVNNRVLTHPSTGARLTIRSLVSILAHHSQIKVDDAKDLIKAVLLKYFNKVLSSTIEEVPLEEVLDTHRLLTKLGFGEVI